MVRRRTRRGGSQRQSQHPRRKREISERPRFNPLSTRVPRAVEGQPRGVTSTHLANLALASTNGGGGRPGRSLAYDARGEGSNRSERYPCRVPIEQVERPGPVISRTVARLAQPAEPSVPSPVRTDDGRDARGGDGRLPARHRSRARVGRRLPRWGRRAAPRAAGLARLHRRRHPRRAEHAGARGRPRTGPDPCQPRRRLPHVQPRRGVFLLRAAARAAGRADRRRHPDPAHRRPRPSRRRGHRLVVASGAVAGRGVRHLELHRRPQAFARPGRGR